MKKTFISLFIISLLSVTLLSCNFQFNGTSLLTKPDVEASNNVITISIPLQSSETSHINIYRKKILDSDEDIVNLGIIYPSSLESTASAYIFHDYLIIKNTTYVYKARYKNSDGYYTTNWSNEITAIEGYTEDASLTYDKGTASFTYNDKDYSLTISGTITAPTDIPSFEEDYKPMLIVKNSEETQLFELPSIEDKTKTPLKNFLPNTFLDTPITIMGITGCKQIYVDPEAKEKVIKYLYWIEPTSIEIKGYSDKTITVPTTSGKDDGYDYSN